MTRILLVGSGGREHAMALALASGTPRPTMFFAPGNPGTASLGENLELAFNDPLAVAKRAKALGIDVVVVGPEAPLAQGLADVLREQGIPCAGPSAKAAQLEASKAFCREIAAEAGVPSPAFAVVTTPSELDQALGRFAEVPVIKADGLCAGKGVFLPDTKEEAATIGRKLFDGMLGEAGHTLVLEERLQGDEASLFFACADTQLVALPHARDHKRLGDNDVGPNTGGMGAVSPNQGLSGQLVSMVEAEMVRPTLLALQKRGIPYRGFLFAGIMLTQKGPRLLEFNVRLGDPETQAILPRLGPGSFAKICTGIARGSLSGIRLEVDPRPTCAVVIAAPGYPDSPRTGGEIRVDESLGTDDCWLIHAGTRVDKGNGKLVSNGGRVLAVVGRGHDLAIARRRAYEGVGKIHFDGMQFRRDIGGPPLPPITGPIKPSTA